MTLPLFLLYNVCVQLPESSIGKALRLLHERLSSKIASDVCVESSELSSNGIESVSVSLSDEWIALQQSRVQWTQSESSGILINSSIY